MKVYPATSLSVDQLIALLVDGRYADAEHGARLLLKQNSKLGMAWKILGVALSAQGKCDLDVLLMAAELLPQDAETRNNLAMAFHSLGRLDEAVESYRMSIFIEPEFAGAHSNLGNALRDLGRFDESSVSLLAALRIKPDYAEAHNNLGLVLQALGQFDESYACYHRALEIRPDYPEAINNLGNVARDMGQVDVAEACFRRALEMNPDYSAPYSNLLFTHNFRFYRPQTKILADAKSFANQFETPLKKYWPQHTNDRDPNKRMRIGYVSGDFSAHAVAYFFESILANHDETQVETYCYSNNYKHDGVTERLMAEADHWCDCVGMTDHQLATRILADGIDILVDLSGHTAANRLQAFARKPAPIEITYLGYPGTSGLSAMDYRLTDSYAEPEGSGAEAYYVEKLLRLPDSLWCYRPADDMPEITPLPALTNRYITFGSFNNFNKLSNECIALWSKLLLGIPDSRLLVATVPEGIMRERLAAQFKGNGIEVHRIVFLGKLSSQEFRRKLQEVDINLDPFPVNGATTTCESLWLGVPVLTMIGERFLTRAGLSILSAAGMADFAVSTEEDFIKTATLLATNFPLLSQIRGGLREHLQCTPLFDQARFTRNLEDAYRGVWRVYVSTNVQ